MAQKITFKHGLNIDIKALSKDAIYESWKLVIGTDPDKNRDPIIVKNNFQYQGSSTTKIQVSKTALTVVSINTIPQFTALLIHDEVVKNLTPVLVPPPKVEVESKSDEINFEDVFESADEVNPATVEQTPKAQQKATEKNKKITEVEVVEKTKEVAKSTDKTIEIKPAVKGELPTEEKLKKLGAKELMAKMKDGIQEVAMNSKRIEEGQIAAQLLAEGFYLKASENEAKQKFFQESINANIIPNIRVKKAFNPEGDQMDGVVHSVHFFAVLVDNSKATLESDFLNNENITDGFERLLDSKLPGGCHVLGFSSDQLRGYQPTLLEKILKPFLGGVNAVRTNLLGEVVKYFKIPKGVLKLVKLNYLDILKSNEISEE